MLFAQVRGGAEVEDDQHAALSVDLDSVHETAHDGIGAAALAELEEQVAHHVGLDERGARLHVLDLESQHLALALERPQFLRYGPPGARLRGEVDEVVHLAVDLREALPHGLHGLALHRLGFRLGLHRDVHDRLVEFGVLVEHPRDGAAHALLGVLLAHRRARGFDAVVVVALPVARGSAARLVEVAVHVEHLAREQVRLVLDDLSGAAHLQLRVGPVPCPALDYGGDAALHADLAPAVHADVLLVPEHLLDGLHAELPAALAPPPALVEVAGGGGLGGAGVEHREDRADALCLVLVDLVRAVGHAVVTEDLDAVVVALERVPLHAAQHVLREVGAVVLGHALQHRFEDDVLWAVRHALRRAQELHARLAQLGLVRGGVVAVAGEAV
nr:hypothetical protein [Collinsella intestinalis]